MEDNKDPNNSLQPPLELEEAKASNNGAKQQEPSSNNINASKGQAALDISGDMRVATFGTSGINDSQQNVAAPMILISPTMTADNKKLNNSSIGKFENPMNSTMIQSDLSLNNSALMEGGGTRSHSRYGAGSNYNRRSYNNSGYNAIAANANKQILMQQLMKQVRPQSALANVNVTPTLAYKRVKQPVANPSINNSQPKVQYSSKLGYHAVRKATKTPGKSQQLTVGSSSNNRLSQNNFRGSGITPFTHNHDLKSSQGTSNPNPETKQYLDNSASALLNNRGQLAPEMTRNQVQSKSYSQLSRSKRSANKSFQSLRGRFKDQGNTQTFGVRPVGHYAPESSTSTLGLLGPGTYDPHIDVVRPRSPSAIFEGPGHDAKIPSRDGSSGSPAPGQYLDLSQFGSDAVKISIHPKLNQGHANRNPGPGTYNPQYNQVMESIHNTKISPARNSTSIENLQKQQMPGPGTYDINQMKIGVDTPAYTISNSPSKALISSNPGPNQYNPNIAVTREKSPEYTIGAKHYSSLGHRKTKSNIGPGYYHQQAYIGKEGPKYTISNSNGPKQKNLLPGPGFYNPNDDAIKEKVKAFKINQRDKPSGLKPLSTFDGAPPPGAYNINKTIGQEAPKYSMGSRSKSRPNLSPGPGQYNPTLEFAKYRPAAFKFSPTKKSNKQLPLFQGSSNPGPGSYKTIDTFGKNAPKISIHNKLTPNPASLVPGPGSYKPNISFTRQASPMHGMGRTGRNAIVSKEKQQIPGPGQYYSPEKFGSDAPKVLIHEKLNPNNKNRNPGPGYYNPNGTLVRERSPAYGMDGSLERPDTVSNERKASPGPGTYVVNSVFTPGKGDMPVYTIGLKHNTRNDNRVPGPGTYDPNMTVIQERHPTFTVSKVDRLSPVGKEERERPGPGVYDPRMLKYPQISYSMSQLERASPVGRDARMSPGPAYYNKPQTFGHDGIHHTIGERMPDQSWEQYPAPGQYDPNRTLIERRSPLAKILPEQREQGIKFAPGPGHYNPLEQIVRERSPEYQFGPGSERHGFVAQDKIDFPGPGYYDFKQLIGQDGSLKFTHGRRSAERPLNNNPGPGYYDPKDGITHERPPLANFSKLQRSSEVPLEQRERPGPGTYDVVDSRYPNIKYTMSHLERQSPMSRDQRLNPGPGHYSSPQKFGDDGIHYSIGKRPLVNIHDANPPPGSYDPLYNLAHNRSPSAKILPYHESPRIKNTPGPGQYNPRDEYVRQSSPNYRIGGQTQRLPINSKDYLDMPGPGYYDQKQLIGGPDSLKYTVGQKPSYTPGNNNPGPGYYNPNDTLVHENSPPKSFSKLERADIVPAEQRNMPGPGTFNPIDNRYPDISYKFSHLERPDTVSRDARTNPGPGHYDKGTLIGGNDAPHYTIGERRQNFDQDQFPAPGQYDPQYQQIEPRSPLAKILPSHHEPSISVTPGPGTYDPKDEFVKEQAPIYKIGGTTDRASPVSLDQMQMPGPGHYDTKQLIGGDDSNKFTIGQRHDGRQDNGVPGPGHYNPLVDITKDHAPNYTVSPTNRMNEVPQDLRDQPGPGYYDQPNGDCKYPNVSHKFSQMERPHTVSRDQRNNPGPGQYNMPETLGKESPNYTMGTIHPSAEQDQYPGPGSYNPNNEFCSPRSPLSKITPYHPDYTNRSEVPGPGYYEPDLSAVKERAPAPKIARSKREFLTVSGNDLGPGSYNTALPNNSLSYTIGEKPKQASDNNYPGPTTYTASHTQTDLRSPEYDFSRSPERAGLSRNDNELGPGAYNPKADILSGNTSLAYSIPKGENVDPVDRNPGPGYYKIPVKFGEQKLFAQPIINEEWKWV